MRQTVPYGWLRDQDPKQWHRNGQRLSTMQNWPDQLHPDHVELSGTQVRITWSGDSHLTEIDTHALWSYGSSQEHPAGMVMWNRMLETDLCIFDHKVVAESAEQRLNWLQTFQEYGFAGLRGIPLTENALEQVIQVLGPIRETNFGRIFEICVKENPANLSDSSLALPPRTENPYRDPAPGIHTLFCIRPAAEGGDIILVDGAFILRKLQKQSPQAYRLLVEIPVKFRYRDEQVWLEHERCIVEESPDGALRSLAFNNRSVNQFVGPQAQKKGWYQAYRFLEKEILNPKNQIHIELRPGELLLINNRRILHGQTAYSACSDRLLLGCYLEHDQVHSELRRLR